MSKLRKMAVDESRPYTRTPTRGFIKSGHSALDAVLDGGYQKGAITTIYAPPFRHWGPLLLSALYEARSPGVITVNMADTEAMRKAGLDMGEVSVCRCTDFHSVLAAYEVAGSRGGQFDLLILDSLSALCTDSSGLEFWMEQQELLGHLRTTSRMATTAVIVTCMMNQRDESRTPAAARYDHQGIVVRKSGKKRMVVELLYNRSKMAKGILRLPVSEDGRLAAGRKAEVIA